MSNRTFRHNDLDGDKTITEQEILDTYYPYWCEQMKKVGKQDLISPELCIEDWIVIHWAWEVK